MSVTCRDCGRTGESLASARHREGCYGLFEEDPKLPFDERPDEDERDAERFRWEHQAERD